MNKDVLDVTYITPNGSLAVDIYKYLQTENGKRSLKKLLQDVEKYKKDIK